MMKRLLTLALFTCAVATLFVACDDDDNTTDTMSLWLDQDGDENITFDELPPLAQDYLDMNFEGVAICEVEVEDDSDADYAAEVTLVTGIEIYFDEEGRFLFSEENEVFEGCDEDDDDEDDDDEDDEELTFDELPQGVQDYLNANYPDSLICEIYAETDSNGVVTYEVELLGGLELFLDADGTLISSEQDDDHEGCDEEGDDDDDHDDDDDEELTFDELPQAIQDYLNANYDDVEICSIEIEDDDDEPYTYEVTLVTGLELYFDTDGNLVSSEQDDDFEGCE